MIISEGIWVQAYERIEDYRADKLKRLLSGNCSEKEYARLCGVLEGLTLFEDFLTEARKPKKKDEEDD